MISEYFFEFQYKILMLFAMTIDEQLEPGLGFCHGKSIFARTVEKTGNNRQQLAKSVVHKIG